jgi:hypothetical protein
MKRNFSFFVLLSFMASLFAMISLSSHARADAPAPDKDGYILTGSGVRSKSIAFVSVDVYGIRHDIKAPLPAKSKQAMIDADQDKKFSWSMRHDVDSEKIQNALKDGFKLNGYTDGGKISRFVSAFTKEIKVNQGVSISYNSATKATTIWVQGQGSATVEGVDFMKAVWSLWFGRIDQPSLGDQLISKL